MSDLIELLRKKYKKIYHGHSMPELQHCSCGLLSLDLALGGGLPRGRIIQLYGPPSSGKSTLAFTFVRAFQHREEPCLYIDLEGTGQKNDMQRHRLLENETFNYATPPDGEEAINMALDAAEYGAKIVVIDSVPYLRSKDAVNKEVGERSFAAVSTLISNNLNKLTHTFRTTNSILLLINQLRANTYAGTLHCRKLKNQISRHPVSYRTFTTPFWYSRVATPVLTLLAKSSPTVSPQSRITSAAKLPAMASSRLSNFS